MEKWRCGQCNAENPQSRALCVRCGAVKPVSRVVVEASRAHRERGLFANAGPRLIRWAKITFWVFIVAIVYLVGSLWYSAIAPFLYLNPSGDALGTFLRSTMGYYLGMGAVYLVLGVISAYGTSLMMTAVGRAAIDARATREMLERERCEPTAPPRPPIES